MKALKEKRISLRSLLRRSLVILSLLALVFASCGDSSSDDDNGNFRPNGPEIARVVITAPGGLPTQYHGRPVDMTGVQATVFYKDTTIPAFTDTKLTNFSASPTIYTGAYDFSIAAVNANGGRPPFVGMGDCTVSYKASDGRTYAQVMIVTGVGIKRDDSTITTTDPNQNPWNAYNPGVNNPGTAGNTDPTIRNDTFDQGVHLTGLNSPIRQRVAYADDDKFDFSGLVLEADYYDGAKYEINFSEIVANDSWKILPDYTRRNQDGTHPGWVYVTVGKNPLRDIATGEVAPFGVSYWFRSGLPYDYYMGLMADPRTNAKMGTDDYFYDGMTVIIPLDKVYTVTELAWVEPEEPEPFIFFYMWENDEAAWRGRIGDWLMRVSYTGGVPAKVFSINQWYFKRHVWWNDNFRLVPNDWELAYTPANANNIRPLWIRGVTVPFVYKTNPNPRAEVYYRGYILPLRVDVYTALQGIRVEGEPVFDWVRIRQRDNDRPIQDGITTRVQWHNNYLKVYATYQAYNHVDPPLYHDFELLYEGEAESRNQYGINDWLIYDSTFGAVALPILRAGDPPNGIKQQTFDGIVGEASKYQTEVSKAIRITHLIDSNNSEFPTDSAGAIIHFDEFDVPVSTGITKNNSKNASIAVIWTTVEN
jgi:hypothetical protein